MQNLRDKLLKAKVIDKKQKRSAEHQERVQRKEEDLTPAERERLKREEHAEREQKRRERDRARETARHAEREMEAQRFGLRDMVKAGTIKDQGPSTIRFHFVTRAGAIPQMWVSDKIMERLLSGDAAVVQVPGVPEEEFRVVDRRTADRLEEWDQSYLLFRGPDRGILR